MFNPYRTRGFYRSRHGIFLGVCRGLAERFDLSPWGVRLLFVALQFTVVHLMFLIYIVLALLMKRGPERSWKRYAAW
ncbi:MAG: PspC domain-containing protein [Candidatus Sumerlaeota bacterium]|nr:PspC domain-containing protein [Candidatus Sumerlaeota bacterium]